jgi:hypothetical protein
MVIATVMSASSNTQEQMTQLNKDDLIQKTSSDLKKNGKKKKILLFKISFLHLVPNTVNQNEVTTVSVGVGRDTTSIISCIKQPTISTTPSDECVSFICLNE